MERKSQSKINKTTSKVAHKNISVKSVNDDTYTNEDANISIITKTTKPKVIINSEKIEYNEEKAIEKKKTINILRFLCSIIMGIIILITFFISLRTYNIIKKTNTEINIIYDYLFE